MSRPNSNEKAARLESPTAEDLAVSVQRGSKADFAELVNRFGPRLYRYFRQKIRSREDCEDLVQDTLIKAYRNIHRYRRIGRFVTWLYTIGTRLMVDHYRLQQRRRAMPIPGDLPGGMDPLESAARKEARENLWIMARSLSRKQFDALWLRYAEEMSVKEIAGVMGTTRVHAKVLLYRARKRLAELDRRRSAGRSGQSAGESLKEILSY